MWTPRSAKRRAKPKRNSPSSPPQSVRLATAMQKPQSESQRKPSIIGVQAVSLLWHQNEEKKTVNKVRKKERGDETDTYNNGSEDREPKCSHYPVKSTVKSMSMREQQLAKQRMAVLRNDHILMFSEVFETSLASWNSFNVCLLTHNWLTIPKHMPHLLTVLHTCHR